MLPTNLLQYNIKVYANDSFAIVSGPTNKVVEDTFNQANLVAHYLRFSMFESQNNLDTKVEPNNMTHLNKESIKSL